MTRAGAGVEGAATGRDTASSSAAASWIYAVVFLVAAGMLAAVAMLLLAARHDAIDRESRDLARWAATAGDATQRMIFDADLLAAALEEELTEKDANSRETYANVAASREMHEWMRDAVLVAAGADSISLTDANGTLKNSSRVWPPPDVNVSDRSYFVQLREQPDVPFVITDPLQSRIASIETLLLVRRVNGRLGEFLGVISTTVPTARLTRQFASTFDGVPVSVTLQRRNGQVLLRHPESRPAGPRSPAVEKFFAETLARADGGTLHIASPDAEGEPRLIAVQALRGYPLAITVSKPQSAVLAEWRRQARWMGALTAGAVLLMAGLGWALARQWRLRLLAIESTKLRAINAELEMRVGERERAEQALRQLNDELEARVEQRTEQLRSARDAAESASRAKSDFLSGMSHELRTPLNAVLGFAQLLEADRQPALSPRQLDFVRHIRRSGDHLLELINEVLDLARVEAGRLTTSLEPVALAPIVQECIALVQTQAQARGVRLELGALPPAWHAQADRTRARQVLLNLLSNAIKYNRPEGVVHVSAQRLQDAGGARVRISVRDSGGGLSEQQQARLFVPFERLGADELSTEGTGIGLALSKRLMELMSGSIGVDSIPGEGSCFWVEWPQAQPSAASRPPGPPNPHRVAAGAAPAPGSEAFDVLCIEDNAVNLLLVEQILSRHPGVRLRAARHPREGLAQARARRPDLVLLDVDLPDMDGYEVLRHLRADPATRTVPVLAISANAMPSDTARGLAAGFAAYLTKPIDIEAFDRTLVEHLGSSRKAAG